MQESGEIANLETVLSKEEVPLRMRLIIFNHVSRNGRVYIAESKEEIQNLINKEKELYLTNGFNDISDNQYIKVSDIEEDYMKIATMQIKSLIGSFKDIEITETGDIGVNGFPIFEVYGTLNLFNLPTKQFHEDCFNANIVTIGMRSLGNVDQDKNVKLNRIVCWDTIVR